MSLCHQRTRIGRRAAVGAAGQALAARVTAAGAGLARLGLLMGSDGRDRVSRMRLRPWLGQQTVCSGERTPADAAQTQPVL
jgi:hypothetical protein